MTRSLQRAWASCVLMGSMLVVEILYSCGGGLARPDTNATASRGTPEAEGRFFGTDLAASTAVGRRMSSVRWRG
jgi:hypothetical protein